MIKALPLLLLIKLLSGNEILRIYFYFSTIMY